jgi:hypothetical protein
VPDWKRAEWACDVLPEGGKGIVYQHPGMDTAEYG